MNGGFSIRGVKYRGILDLPRLDIGGEVTCITGPSGSGKTTLLRLLNRLSAPDEGTVSWQGQDLARVDAVALRRQVVMLAQGPVLYPGGIRENLQAGLRLSGSKDAPEDRLRRALELAGLYKDLDGDCATLSGGERQRLCIARVALMDAKAYLLDEPSAALDRQTEGEVLTRFVDFCREHGRQVVMVTHSEKLVEALHPALVRLEGGKLREVRDA